MFDLLFLFTFSASTTFLFEFHFIWFRWFCPHSSSSSHFLLPTILFYVCFEYWLFIFMIFQHCVSFFSYFEILILLLFMYFLRDIFPFQLYIHDVCCEETVSRHVPLYILGFVRNVLIVYWKYSLSEKQSLDFIF